MLLNADILQPKFEEAMSYAEFVAVGEPEGHRPPWDQRYAELGLDPAQEALVKSFTRPMNVLCLTGTWCGDCALQGAAMTRIAEAGRTIDLRYVDRDEHLDLTEQIKINAGSRIPVAVLMAEDFEPVSIFGDRSLARYRALAAKNLGGACPLPGAPVPDDEMQATLQDWLDEIERVHLILRLSARLRQMHGD